MTQQARRKPKFLACNGPAQFATLLKKMLQLPKFLLRGTSYPRYPCVAGKEHYMVFLICPSLFSVAHSTPYIFMLSPSLTAPPHRQLSEYS